MARIVIIGASLVGVRAAETLRAQGHTGPVTMISAEDHLPYDRPPLSKTILTGAQEAESIRYVDHDWAGDHDIDLRLGTTARGLDTVARRVDLGDEQLDYEALIIATGARARDPFPDAPTGTWTLRTLDDALAIRQALARTERLVVVGGGFIGLEVASSAIDLGVAVTVVEAAPVPLARCLGPETTEAVVDTLDRAGVDLRCGRAVARIHGTDTVTGVELDDGTMVPCQTVVVGIGSVPNVEWLAGSGLRTDGPGVVCDATGRAAPGVWAAGDVAAWSDPDGVPRRQEHWTAAGDQARTVAMNVLDDGHRTVTAPHFVWSDQFGQRISLVGDTTGTDSDVRRVSDDKGTAATLFTRDGVLVGACVFGRPRLVLDLRRHVAATAAAESVPAWTEAEAVATV